MVRILFPCFLGMELDHRKFYCFDKYGDWSICREVYLNIYVCHIGVIFKTDFVEKIVSCLWMKCKEWKLGYYCTQDWRPVVVLSFVIWNIAWFVLTRAIVFTPQRMGGQAPAASGDSGWMAQGPSHMALPGAHFQLSRHYVSNAWRRQTIFICG